MNLKEFLARQLNDHSDSPSGVVQKTFYEFTESHIEDALSLALCYLYSLMPQDFTEVKEIKITKKNRTLDVSKTCDRFIRIVSMISPEGKDIDISEKDAEIRSLLPLLKTPCRTQSQTDESQEYDYEVVDGTKSILWFDKPLPVGVTVIVACSKQPTLDDMEGLCQYHPLLSEYALWWLFRTDSESRSNLERAKLHFEGVRDFVVNKLLLEFSLREDDYSFGRRKVTDL